jgi:thiol:disulfide interchange protein DsbA
MTITRRSVLSLLALTAFAAGAGHAAQKDPFIVLERPQPVDAPGKIEVIEFFWYGCPHCSRLEPEVEAFEKQLPKDVAFRREHIVWDGRADTEMHARVFLTLRAMGLQQHHRAVFEAIHGSKAGLKSDKEVFEWAAKHGIDRAKFEAAYKSFGVNTQLARAKALTEKYLVDTIPAFAINGKYFTSMRETGGGKQLLETVNKLIAGERGKK